MSIHNIPSLDSLPLIVRRSSFGKIYSGFISIFWTIISILSLTLSSKCWQQISVFIILSMLIIALFSFAKAFVEVNHCIKYAIFIRGDCIESGGLFYNTRYSWEGIDGIHVWNDGGPFKSICITFKGKGHKPPMSHQGWRAWAYRSPNVLLFPGYLTVSPEPLALLMKRARIQWLSAGENLRSELSRIS